ncbi:AsmA-like C-terminal domain-containing protein [Thermodesulfobacteriota bacterium]
MIRGKFNSFLRLGVLLSLLFVSSILLIHSLLQRPSVQQYLLGRLSGALDYEITSGKISLYLWGRIGLQAQDFKARSQIGDESIEAARVTLFFDPVQLIRGRLVPIGASLIRPKIELDPETFSSFGSKKSKEKGNSFFKSLFAFPSFFVDQATLRIKGQPYWLNGFYFEVFKRNENREESRLVVVFRGNVAKNHEEVFLKGRGVLEQAEGKAPTGNMTLEMKDFPLKWIPFPEEIIIDKGSASALVNLKGTPEGIIQSQGRIKFKGTSFSLVEDKRSKSYELPEIAIDYKLSYSKGAIKISSFDFKTPEFVLAVESDLDFNNFSNPTLNLRVESPFLPIETFIQIIPTPLLPAWLENRILKSLKKGHVKVDHFALNGTLEDIENLDMRENKDVLSTQVSWKGLKMDMGEGALPVDNISGKLAVENGRLSVSKVTGNFGLSDIKVASLDVDDLYAEISNYLISIDGIFHLQDLMRQSDVPLIPRDVRNILNKIEPINGKMMGHTHIAYRDGWDYPRLVAADLRFEDFVITQEMLLFPVTLDELNLKVGRGKKSRFRARGAWAGTEFEADGTAEEGWKRGEAVIKAIADLEQGPRFYEGIRSSYKLSGPVPGEFSLTWSEKSISCRGEIDLGNIILETPTICVIPTTSERRIHFQLELEGMKNLHLKNATCYLGESVLNVSGLFDREENRIKNLAFSTAGLELEALGFRFKDQDRTAKGTITGHGTIKDFSLNLPDFQITGILQGDDLYISGAGLASPITGCRFRVEFLGKQAIIHSMNFNMGKSIIFLNGKLQGWYALNGDLSVDAEYLDIEDFISEEDRGDYKEEAFHDKYINRSRIELKLNVMRGIWRKMNLNRSRAELLFSGGDVYVKRSNISLEHGTVDLEGHIEKDAQDHFNISFRLADQPAKELLESLRLAEGSIEGFTSLHGTMNMRGNNEEELISSLGGHANLRFDKGKIHKSSVLIGILKFLSLQKIFIAIPKDLSKGGFYFDSIECDLEMKDGMVTTDNLFMVSPIINMAGRGKVDLPKDRVDFDLAVQPLGTIDTLLKYIPIVGHILKGEEESILVYYFKVSGTLAEQKTDYLPLKNLGNSFLGFFKRILLAPKGIVDGVTDTIGD